ncbi:TetR/AcrR family transcriptional regulator [Aestuariivirga sp.]|uniref:TetR/AcrR family transcriptional regulator n=1 Tax=Aestuariivirga sp. TaxID=2650926 RepID=UPI0039E50B0C
MPATALLAREPATPEHDSEKRRQILDGARATFLAQGFDGASMNDIVRAAGVSKATVYAYFPSKEKLFEALVSDDKRQAVEQTFSRYIGDTRPAREVLTDIARNLSGLMCMKPSMSYARTVIAASAKFPGIGRAFYEAGPRYGATILANFLRARVEAGEFKIDDVDLAAMQFQDLCLSSIVKPLLYGCAVDTSPERLEHVAQSAVRVFFAAYATDKNPRGL